MNEIWKPIPEYEGYEASNIGNIRNSNKELLYICKTGTYYLVTLKGYGQHSVHRLVCAAFHGVPEYKQEVDHIDGDTHNNCSDNLEWVSHRENGIRAYKLGLNTITEQRRQKLRDSYNSRSDEVKYKMCHGHTGHRHSEETKLKFSLARKGKNLGRVWINNGVISKWVLPQDLSNYLENGYTRGRIRNSKNQ